MKDGVLGADSVDQIVDGVLAGRNAIVGPAIVANVVNIAVVLVVVLFFFLKYGNVSLFYFCISGNLGQFQ